MADQWCCLHVRGWGPQEEELKDTSLLVFANKQDLDNAMSVAEISEGLGLTALKGRQWQIFKTSAIKGEGLTEGLDWYGAAAVAAAVHKCAWLTGGAKVSICWARTQAGQHAQEVIRQVCQKVYLSFVE